MSGWGRGQRTLVNSSKQFVSVVLAHSHSCAWGYTSLCGLNQPLQRNMGQPWPLVSSKIHQDVSSVCSEALIKQSEFPRRWAPTPSSTYVLLCINTSYRSAVRAKARCVLTADLHPSWLPLAMSSFNLSFFPPQHFMRWTVSPEYTESVRHVCRLCVTTSRHAHARPGCCCGAVKGQQLLQKPSLNASVECSEAHLRPFSLSDRKPMREQ